MHKSRMKACTKNTKVMVLSLARLDDFNYCEACSGLLTGQAALLHRLCQECYELRKKRMPCIS